MRKNNLSTFFKLNTKNKIIFDHSQKLSTQVTRKRQIMRQNRRILMEGLGMKQNQSLGAILAKIKRKKDQFVTIQKKADRGW